MSGVVITGCPRVPPDTVAAFTSLSVATVHEAQGRSGQLASYIRPIYNAARAVGTAVTVLAPPCDNWMLHVAVEQCQKGDILVVAATSPSDAGYFGELLATSLMARRVRGLVIDAGCRDTKELKEMGFPVWSRSVTSQGTVKETLGSVNLAIVCAGQVVHPGDLVVADDDGVVIVPRSRAGAVAAESVAREARETEMRARLKAGELGLDIYGMRSKLAAKGLIYKQHEAE